MQVQINDLAAQVRDLKLFLRTAATAFLIDGTAN